MVWLALGSICDDFWMSFGGHFDSLLEVIFDAVQVGTGASEGVVVVDETGDAMMRVSTPAPAASVPATAPAPSAADNAAALLAALLTILALIIVEQIELRACRVGHPGRPRCHPQHPPLRPPFPPTSLSLHLYRNLFACQALLLAQTCIQQYLFNISIT